MTHVQVLREVQPFASSDYQLFPTIQRLNGFEPMVFEAIRDAAHIYCIAFKTGILVVAYFIDEPDWDPILYERLMNASQADILNQFYSDVSRIKDADDLDYDLISSGFECLTPHE